MINFDLSLDDRVDCLQVRRISHQRNMHLQAIPWHDSLWRKLDLLRMWLASCVVRRGRLELRCSVEHVTAPVFPRQ